MLGKLLKYEIRAFGRVMLPLYGVMLAVSVLFSVMIRMSMNSFAKSLFEKFAIIGGFLFVIAIVAVMVVMVVMIVQRFYKNLLGTEGYLMFTLPASTLDHILSKGISALLWIALGAVTGLVSGAVMVAITGDLSEFIDQFGDAMKMLNGDGQLLANVLLLLVMMVMGLMATLSKVYASFAIGHQFNSHRLLWAVVAYIVIGIAEVCIASIPPLRAVIGSDQAQMSIRQFAVPGLCISCLQVLIYGVITWRLLDRRLNLE